MHKSGEALGISAFVPLAQLVSVPFAGGVSFALNLSGARSPARRYTQSQQCFCDGQK